VDKIVRGLSNLNMLDSPVIIAELAVMRIKCISNKCRRLECVVIVVEFAVQLERCKAAAKKDFQHGPSNNFYRFDANSESILQMSDESMQLEFPQRLTKKAMQLLNKTKAD
jgi:hypothetical protein